MRLGGERDRDLGGTHGDEIAGRDRAGGAEEGDPVDAGPVDGAEVLDGERAFAEADQRVPARHARVGDDNRRLVDPTDEDILAVAELDGLEAIVETDDQERSLVELAGRARRSWRRAPSGRAPDARSEASEITARRYHAPPMVTVGPAQ